MNKFRKDVIDGIRPNLSLIPDSEIQSFFKRCCLICLSPVDRTYVGFGSPKHLKKML